MTLPFARHRHGQLMVVLDCIELTSNK